MKHGIWLVPVHVDVDGSLMRWCPYPDGPPDFWSAYCDDCRAVVGEGPAPHTIGVSDIDGLSDAAWDAIWRWEQMQMVVHRHAVRLGWPVSLPPRMPEGYVAHLRRRAQVACG